MSRYACLDVCPCTCLNVAKCGRINHDFVIRPFFNTVAHETRIQSLLCAVEASGALYLYTIQFKGHTVPMYNQHLAGCTTGKFKLNFLQIFLKIPKILKH